MWQNRKGCTLKPGKIGHHVVDWFQLPSVGVPEQLTELALGFACKDRDAEVQRLLDFGRNSRQHRQATADVETANTDRHIGGPQWAGDVDSSRKLIRLNPDESNETPATACLNFANDLVRLDSVISLVKGGNDDIDSLSQNSRCTALKGDAV